MTVQKRKQFQPFLLVQSTRATSSPSLSISVRAAINRLPLSPFLWSVTRFFLKKSKKKNNPIGLCAPCPQTFSWPPLSAPKMQGRCCLFYNKNKQTPLTLQTPTARRQTLSNTLPMAISALSTNSYSKAKNISLSLLLPIQLKSSNMKY
jgi:hypothetical protein